MKKPDPLLKTVSLHIIDSWRKTNRHNLPYPFIWGRHSKLLQWACGIYGHAMVMALWDLFISERNDFYQKAHYSLEMFQVALPALLDKDIKPLQKYYEDRLCALQEKSIEQAECLPMDAPGPERQQLLHKILNKEAAKHE